MRIFRVLLALVGIAAALFAADDFAPRTIIVKFRAGTPELDRWLATGRNGTIPMIGTLFGQHQSRPYLRDEVLRALSLRLQRYNARSSDNPIARLERIAIVEFNRDVDVQLIARKLGAHPAVEYAEPMPVRRVFFQPNDSLFSQQYHLTRTRAIDAWDSIPSNAAPVLIAIVDTGVDYTHEDLANVIFTNPGETGTDAQGRDKRSNGVDDDGNGFVDDWRGWDFGRNDNDPMPGNVHGTHVAGTAAAQVNNRIGVAGISHKARILPVKCATDSPVAPSIVNGYEGIAYAAAMGASVINCSWGGGTSSQAEQEVINTVSALGSLVVAAAGNSGTEELIYPGGYTGVISVAATGPTDARATFSSYHTMVDISAPGVSILATYPGNSYGTADGTSMASPIVAGVAALVKAKYPGLSPGQIIARLKATADPIDQVTGNRNRAWMGKIGTGRVNAYRAVTEVNPKYVELISATITDDGDGVFEPGEVITIVPTFRNLLAPVTNAIAVIRPVGIGSNIYVFSDSVTTLGTLGSDAIMTAPTAFRLTIPQTATPNYVLTCQIVVTEGSKAIGGGVINFVIFPTYRTLRNGDLVLTVNSRGNFAYNDYPTNVQGEGFRYKGSPSVLFEAGLIVGWNDSRVSDVARNENNGSSQSSDFLMTIPTTLQTIAADNSQVITTSYADGGSATQANVSISQQAYAFSQDGMRDFALSAYRITNRNPEPVETMYCGIYADWDIGQSGQNDIAIWSNEDNFYYMYNTSDTSLPYVGMQVVSAHQPNAFMMDNGGQTTDNPGVYDGYTKAEKWLTISSGIARTRSNVTDASAVVAAGPFRVDAGATEQVVFSIFAGRSLSDLRSAAERARRAAQQLLGITPAQPSPNSITVQVMPNPVASDNLTIEYTVADAGTLCIEITDLLGRTIATVLPPALYPLHGRTNVQLDEAWGNGMYFAVVRSNRQVVATPFVVVR
ncbi:MAG: S8 family serine peptidase [Chlorobi bacterium]|nr:S8 family serine peptidase [Chlorobiota bacterium]